MAINGRLALRMMAKEHPMTTGFRLLPIGLEEAQFKREPDGWLFTTVNPWVFAPRRTYLVSDAQKPAIAARVRRARYVRLVAVMFLLPLGVAALLMAPELMNPHLAMAWVALAAFGIVSAIVITLGDHFTIRPLLRGIPRTSRKIGYVDMVRTQTRALSVKALSIFTLIFLSGAANSACQLLWSPRGSEFGAIGAIVYASLTILFGGMLVAKLRLPKTADNAAK
jgi:hypothetical protein